METTPFILNEYKAFSLQTKIAEAKLLFNETTFCCFPIVENSHLIGVIAENDIEGIDDISASLDNYQYLFNHFFIEEGANLLDIIKNFAKNEANIAPVLNSKHEYIGYYDLTEVLSSFNQTPFLNHEGVVLLIEKEIRDYSLSEVCQIVESNNGKISGVFISESNATKVKITVKFNAQDVNEIIQSFRRYDYQVLSNLEEDFYLEDLKDRSKYLRKYLNI
jgi:hypothetical protein